MKEEIHLVPVSNLSDQKVGFDEVLVSNEEKRITELPTENSELTVSENITKNDVSASETLTLDTKSIDEKVPNIETSIKDPTASNEFPVELKSLAQVFRFKYLFFILVSMDTA